MRRVLTVVVALVGALFFASEPALAQEQPEPDQVRDVSISYELGGFDASIHDFLVTAVEVQGGLDDGQEFTVELRGSGDRVVWAATQPFTAPSIRISVGSKVGVGDVTSAGISQKTTEVLGAQIVPSDIAPAAPSTAGSGQLALSMVLTLLIVVIVFRTPLPSASTQRWTR
jgi:hypothetical protein